MGLIEVSRTLVKSPPEVWAEIESADGLSRWLGEIRVTKVDADTSVEWETDCARGAVAIEKSGWGTRVRVTAEMETAVDADPVDVDPPDLTDPVAVAVSRDVATPREDDALAARAQRAQTASPSGMRTRGRRLIRRLAWPSRAAGLEVSPSRTRIVDLPAAPSANDDTLSDHGPDNDVAAPEDLAAPTADLEARCTRMLDDLGSAHRRPYTPR